MKRIFAVLLCLLVVVACAPDLTGIEDASKYAAEMVDALEVESAVCTPDSLAVGEIGLCKAYSPNGVELSYQDVGIIIWHNTTPGIINLDVSGAFTAIAPGTAGIVARGSRGSSQAVLIKVTE